MNFGDIISNSFKYPFKDLKHLGFFCFLFVLLLILPAGIFIFKNQITIIFGIVGLLIFILIMPGYRILVIKSGIEQSGNIPSIKVKRSIINTLKLLVINISYIALPTLVAAIIMLFATGLLDYPVMILNGASDLNMTLTLNLLSGLFNAIWTTLIVVAIVRAVFTLLTFIARARLANSKSLIEALKIHEVIRDIKKIGFLKFIGWYFVMGILISLISMIGLLVLFIPYVGFILFVCILLPAIYLIYDYSLGLLYSDLRDENDDDLDKFEKELRYLKYGLIH